MAKNNDDMQIGEDDECIDLTEGDPFRNIPMANPVKQNPTKRSSDRPLTMFNYAVSKSNMSEKFRHQHKPSSLIGTTSTSYPPSLNPAKMESKSGKTVLPNTKENTSTLQTSDAKTLTRDSNSYKQGELLQTDPSTPSEKRSKHPAADIFGPKKKMVRYETMENLGSTHKTNENPISAPPTNSLITYYKNQRTSESLMKKPHQQSVPLAERYRPKELTEFLGHEELMGENGPMRKLIETDQLPSFILWGPPGCGKTSIAEVISKLTKRKFFKQSAASCGLADIRKIINEVMYIRTPSPRPILFLDEIHRFNKSQQDYLLPFVEKGTIILIGATTQNPSFEVNSALLSRCRTFKLEKLEEVNLVCMIKRAAEKEGIEIEDQATNQIAAAADGDGRMALNLFEMAVNLEEANTPHTPIKVTSNHIQEMIKNKSNLLYDRMGDGHYDFISALHKSVRGSDKNAATYYLARMLEAGEGPLYIARRLIRMSTEDIGLADPNALTVCVSAYQASHFLGMPECTTALAMATSYLCDCPKSNAIEIAYENAKKCIYTHPDAIVPYQLRNAPTHLLKNLNYSEGYIYTNQPQILTPQQQTCVYGVRNYLPHTLKDLHIFPDMNKTI